VNQLECVEATAHTQETAPTDFNLPKVAYLQRSKFGQSWQFVCQYYKLARLSAGQGFQVTSGHKASTKALNHCTIEVLHYYYMYVKLCVDTT